MRTHRIPTMRAAILALGLLLCAAPAMADAGPDREWADLFDPQNRQEAGLAADDSPEASLGSANAPIVRRDDASRLHAGRRASEELIAWLQAGEKAYRERRADEAMQIFRRIVEADPARSHAWLRIGNLHHQRRQWFQALTAYRRAAVRPGADAGELAEVTRRKALHNLAAINLELARQSLREMERLGPVEGSPETRATLGRAIDAVERQLESVAPISAGSSAPTQARRGEPPRIDYIRGQPDR